MLVRCKGKKDQIGTATWKGLLRRQKESRELQAYSSCSEKRSNVLFEDETTISYTQKETLYSQIYEF